VAGQYLLRVSQVRLQLLLLDLLLLLPQVLLHAAVADDAAVVHEPRERVWHYRLELLPAVAAVCELDLVIYVIAHSPLSSHWQAGQMVLVGLARACSTSSVATVSMISPPHNAQVIMISRIESSV